MRKLTAAAFSLLAAIAAPIVLFAADVAADRQFVVEVVSAEPLYEVAPVDYPAENPVLESIAAGQSIRVLRVRYGKDFESLKVQSPSGNVGWVYTGGGVRVLSRG